ncbi:MAG: XrtA/PEP-CTERM system TPR-repeat protein PrsT [Halioglobus sp.]
MNVGRVAFVFALIAILGACVKESPYEDHIVQAKQFIASSEYDSAVVELKSALLKNRKSAEARWLLGKVYYEVGDLPSAEKELGKSLDLGWSPSDAVPLLAETLLIQGEYDRVRTLTKAGLDSPAQASLLSTKALVAKEQGKRYNAITLVNSALEQEPESVPALLAKARILVGEGDFAGAEIVLENVMPQESENAAAWSVMGDIEIGLKKPEAALEAYDNAINLQRNDYATLFKRALLYLQLENFQAAQVDTTALLRVEPQQPGANYVQGLIHFQAGKYEDAITPLWIGVSDFKRYPLTLFFLSCAQLMTGSIEQASGLAADFQELVPDSIRGRKLLSYIYLQQGKYDDVWLLLDPVLRANADDVDALKLLSSAMLLDSRVNEGFGYLESLARQDSANSFARITLGQGRLLGGDSDDAAQYLETNLELGPDFQHDDILNVMRHMHDQDYESAVVEAQSHLVRNSASIISLNLLGLVYQSAELDDKARELFGKALTADSGDPGANHHLAQMAILEGDLLAARQYYKKILESDKRNFFALIQLALLDEKEDKGDLVVWHLQQAIMAQGLALEPRLLLGQYHLSQGQPEKVGLQFADLREIQQQLPQVLQLKALAKLAKEEKALKRNRQEAVARHKAKHSMDFDLDTLGRRLIVRKVRQMAPAYGLDPNMVLAVIQAESNFNPGARSPANAVGLMQLIPATAARFGVRDRSNPVQNLRGGMAYLRWLLSFFEGDLSLALAGYNAGEGAVTKYLGIPPYPETQNYVRKILRSYGRNRHPPVKRVVKPTRFMPEIRAKQARRI